tara:strand:+ start:282 stop:443 length:162 start_codon:yes stop_codon:yes gene_type:complete
MKIKQITFSKTDNIARNKIDNLKFDVDSKVIKQTKSGTIESMDLIEDSILYLF